LNIANSLEASLATSMSDLAALMEEAQTATLALDAAKEDLAGK